MEQESTRTRTRARWTTALFFVLSGLITASWASRIPHMQQQLRLPNAAWGTVLFMAPVGQVSGLFLAGWLTSRFGVRHTMVGSTVGCASALVLAGACQMRIPLMGALFALGFGRTLLNLSINTRAAEVQRLFPQPIISTFHGLWSLACLAAAGIGTLMIVGQVFPLRHFLLISGLCIALALAYQLKSGKEAHTPPQNRPFFVKPDRYLALLGGICFCSMLAENVLFDWSVNYFAKAVHAPKGLVTAGYTSFIISLTVGRLLGDRLVARFGEVRVISTLGLLLSAGFMLAAALPSVIPAIIGFILMGLGNSVMVPVVFSLASRSKKMSPAYALSAVTLIGYTGFLIGPLLIGLISDAVSMEWAFGLVGVFGIGIFVLAQKVSRFRP